jgi:small multidrug resistance family-3 protein
MRILEQLVAAPGGTLVALSVAAFLEAFGDSCFRTGLFRSSGLMRVASFAGGAMALTLYGLLVNTPRWDFGRLLGAYIVLFFVFVQILASVRFSQRPTPPILIGGFFIVLGGAIISFWKA